MDGDQLVEVDVEELVAVQGEDVTLLAEEPGSEAEASPTAERLLFRRRHDLGADAGELANEELLLAGRAAYDDPVDARAGEVGDLVGGERRAVERHESFGPPFRGVAEPLGPPAREEDRLHYRRRAGSGSPRSGDPGDGRPMPS